jgi:dihydroorotase
VVAVEPSIDAPAGAQVLDADGCWVAPGLVDIHAHLRQPGGEESESVETGARAAALGGYTAVVAMPNTDPPIDSPSIVAEVLALGSKAICRVDVAGTATVGRRGERLAPMAEMARLGVRMFTDDGAAVADSGVLRRALEYARGLGVTIAEHCEDPALVEGGHMNEGAWSSRLGIPGRPAAAEEILVARDIELARLTGGRLHLLHLSTSRSIALLAAARREGLAVTGEVTPHHLSLTDESLAGFDAAFKVFPPLRTADDVAALRAACVDGIVDAIATDHAPHSAEAKDAPIEQAPPGMIGLETAFPVALEALSAEGLAPARLIALMSWRPARIAGISTEIGGDQGGPVAPGSPANLCVLDATANWVVEPAKLASRSRNTPFAGCTLTGRARHTIFRGEPVVVDGEAMR